MAMSSGWPMSAVAQSAGVGINIDNPAGTQCPSTALVNRAVSQHLGEGGAGWRIAYRAKGDAIQLELGDPRGGLALQRDVIGGAGDCQALADAMALIVDRFFAGLGWSAGRPLPVSDPTTVRAAAPPPVTAEAPLMLAVEGGAGLWTRRQNVGTGVFGVRVARRAVEAALHLLGPGTQTRQDLSSGGQAVVSTWGLALSTALGGQLGPLRLHGGPVAIVSREWAHSQNIAVTADNAGTTLAAGLAAGGHLALSPHWRLAVEGWGSRTVAGDRFVIAGVGAVLGAPRFQATAFAALAYAFSW
ncbi:MAG: hypothetical protein QOI66_2477 [Myxococcales bacterium]|nr:hypothetical protein [Myxococcales bacterium]